MKIKIKYYGVIASIAKSRYEEYNLDNSYKKKLYDILREISKIKGKEFEERLFRSKNELESDIIILINGTDIRLLNGLNTDIRDRDEITILSVIHGG